MLNNFETNEFHGDSVALEREKKRVSSVLHLRRGRMENKVVKWNISRGQFF